MILAVPALLLEGAGVMDWLHTHHSLLSSLLLIFSSGVMAFCLNFSIFYVIHSTTAVTFNVAGNLKVNLIPLSFTSCQFFLDFVCGTSDLCIFLQVAVAVMVSWLIFRNPIPALNAIGCAVTLLGCTFYGYVRHKLAQQPGTPQTPLNRPEMLPLVNDKVDSKV